MMVSDTQIMRLVGANTTGGGHLSAGTQWRAADTVETGVDIVVAVRTPHARFSSAVWGNSHALQSVRGLPARLVLGKITQRER